MELEVVRGRRKVLRATHFDTLLAVTHLILLFVEQKQFDKAEKLGWEAYEACEKAFGSDGEETQRILDALAECRKKTGRSPPVLSEDRRINE